MSENNVSLDRIEFAGMPGLWLVGMSSSRKYSWLAAILVAEVLLFIWKYNHFFNGDSLFFFSHQLESWSDVVRVFKGPDHLWQYRPLTFVIFSFLLNPLFGINPLGYNIFPLFVHAANTLIVFGILRRMGLTERATLLGAFYFGVHSTAFYVTYCVAFLPDLSYSFFYLLSVYWFVKYLRSDRYWTMVFSALLFLLALACKEAAITLPVVAFVIAFLWGEKGLSGQGESIYRKTQVALVRTSHFLVFGMLYIGFHWLVKSGQVYALGAGHPHYAEFSLDALRLKYKYLKWAFNLPDGLVFSFEGMLNYLIALAILIFAVPFALSTIRRLWKMDSVTWCGSLWFVIALGPVLFLSNLTMNHNLYVPIAGFALVLGNWMDEILDRFAGRRKAALRFATAAFVIVTLAAVLFHNLQAARHSWIAQASSIAETSLKDLKRLRPVLPDGATLFFVDRSPLGSLRWYYDYGSLVRLFYAAKELKIHFVDRGYSLPGEDERPQGSMVFEYDGSHLSEVTGGS
jgi:hypothetical protein